MRRVSALLVVVALLLAVCPASALAAVDEHACCGSTKVGEVAPRMLSCCDASNVPAQPVGAKPALAKQAGGDAIPATSPTPDRATRITRHAVATHGTPPLPPLLGSCQRRV